MKMLHRYWKPLVLIPVLLLMLVPTASAQYLRSDDTAYLRVKAGLATYLGDNEESPVNFNFDMFDAGFPYGLGAELGYQFTQEFGIGAFYQLGNYTTITQALAVPDPDDLESRFYQRNTVGLLGRYAFGASTNRVAPFIELGVQYSFGDVIFCDTNSGSITNPPTCAIESSAGNIPGERLDRSNGFLGPHAGVGLDIRVAPQLSLLFEASTNIITDDDVLDGRDEDSGFGSFDMLNFVGLGLKFDFKKPFVPVEVLAVEGPQSLITGETGTFTATVNEDVATQPLSYMWNFGDGTTATGQTVDHSYAQPGTYTVTFTATNGNGRASDTGSMTVEVMPPPVPAEIIAITADPMGGDTRTAIRFSANVVGDEPIEYTWDFGDGTTASGPTATHTYSDAGTFTVTLRVQNEHGQDEATINFAITPYEPAYCSTLAEMNSVFFDRNSSTLTEEARAELQENVEVLQECVSLNARVEGFAAPGERNAQQLSEDRARAVEQFYTDNGILASRITAVGLGRVEGMTSKKTGVSEARRVDTIPVR